MVTPLLTATPGAPPTYNPAMAETFSWIPVEGAGRPLFAQATYLANPEDIKLSLSADSINVDLGQIELNTDELESLLRTANSNLTGIDLDITTFNRLLTSQVLTINQNVSATNTRLTNIDTDLDTTNSRLQTLINQTDQIEGYVDGIEGLIGTTNTNTSNINTNTSNINTNLQTVIQQTSAVQSLLTTTVANLTAINDNSITQTTTSTLTSNLLIIGQRKVYSIFGVSTSTNNQYIHIYDSNSSTPVGSPVGVFIVPANSNFSFDISKGLKLTNGCLVINSLTLATYSGGANDLYFTVVHTN